MPLHPNAKRRIAVLVLVILLIAVGVVALTVFRESRKRGDAMDHRAAGMTAYNEKHYLQASTHLHQFLRYQDDDAEAHQRYAEAQLRLPGADARNVTQALRSLLRARELNPENAAVNTQLLDLYLLINKHDEALSLADSLLRREPDSVSALRGRALALSRMRRFTEALDTSKRLVELNPADTDMQLLYLEMENKTHAPNEDLIAYAERVKQEHPEDPRFELVQAYAHYLAGDRRTMTELLQKAASAPAADAPYVNTLVRFADAVGLFPLSLQALTQADQNLDDEGINRELTMRLMELGDYEKVAEHLESVDASADPLDLEGATMRVIALMRTDRRAEAEPIIEQLKDREKDPAAMERGDMLETLFREEGVDADELVVTARTDLQMSPNSPWIRAVFGDAYYARGEPEQAIEQWALATRLRPSWANPLIRQVQPLVALNRPQDAVEQARAALLRAPNSVDAYRAWSLARAANLKNDPADSADSILKVIDEVERLAPGDERMLRLRLSLLEDVNRTDEARRVLTQALDSEQPLSEETLLDLAQRSRRLGLNLEEKALSKSSELHGSTPDLAYTRANNLADRGLGNEGLVLYETEMAGHVDEFDWRLNLARYLDRIDSPRAAEVWRKLAADRPDNDRLQQQALRSPAMRANREFTDQAIKRLEEIGGSSGVTWRVERARWILDGSDSEADAAAAAKLLREALDNSPDRLEAKVLLARAFERMGKLTLAVRELEQVMQSRPNEPSIELELARLNQQQRSYPAALEQLKRVVENPAASPLMLRQAATMLAGQGEDRLALDALVKQQQAGVPVSTDDLLLLAQLYERTGQLGKVQPLVPRIESEPTAASLAWLADWHARAGRADKAQAALDALDNLPLDATQRAAIRADFYARQGQSDQAIEYDAATVKADPSNPRYRLRQVSRLIELGRGTEAVTAAQGAIDAGVKERGLARIVENADAVKLFSNDPRVQGLVLSLMGSTEQADAVQEALRALSNSTDNHDALMRKLESLAETHRDLLPLQLLTAKLYLKHGHADRAATIALRAAETFPMAAEPAWLATEALLESRQADRALPMAREWRAKAPERARQADMQIAAAHLQLRNADAAIAALKPYLDKALVAPDEGDNAQLIARYGQALIVGQRMSEAQRMLKPLAADSPQWRTAAIALATMGASSAREATGWLDAIEQQTPADEMENRIALAQAWWAVAKQPNNLNAKPRARQLIEGVTARPDASAGAWFLRGIMDEGDSDYPAAAASYRKTLELNATLTPVKNNLAMVLAQQDTDLDQAMRLAQEAVDASPTSPNYLDTLAFVAVRAGQYDKAVNALRRAIELEPGNLQWKRNLIGVLEKAGRADEAGSLREQLRADGTR